MLSGIALAILLLSALCAHGSLSTYWLASGTADWSSPSSWNNGVPTSAANAYVGNNATATLTTAGVCSGAYVGQYGSFYKGTGVLTISGSGSLTTGGIFFIGVVNAGTVNQNAGVVTVNGSYLAVEATGSSYNLGGGLLSVPGDSAYEAIGFNATGTGAFSQTGGTNSAVTEYIGDGVASPINTVGTYSQSDGLNTVTTLSIGTLGSVSGFGYLTTGTYTQTGGSTSAGP